MVKHITPKQLMESPLYFPNIRIIHLVGGYYLISKYVTSDGRKLDFIKRNQYILAKVD